MFRIIKNIARTELQELFYSPVAWLILVVFTVQSSLIFALKLESIIQVQELGRNVPGVTLSIFSGMGGVLDGMQNYLYFYIPLLTMGLVSRELSSGSIKLLYSSPVTNFQIIIGKYFSMVLYGLIMMGVLVLLILCGWLVIPDFDWPAVFTGLLGVYLLLCAYAAIGIFMSSLTSYQIVAAIGTLIVLMLLSMVGRWWQDYDFVREVTYWLSINGRCNTFINGMICSEDVLYFIVIICLFLSLTIIRLNAVRQKIRFSITLGRNVVVILIACLLGYFSSRPMLKVYHDSTATKQNTLTPNSQKIVEKLNDDVTITTYINALDLGSAFFASGSFLIPDRKRFERYLRFKPDMKLKYVYYYDETPNPALEKRFPGMSLRQKMIEVCKLYGLDSNKFKTPEEIHSMVDLSEEGNVFVRLIERANGKKTWLRVYDDMQRFPGEQEISAALKRLVMDLPVVGFVYGQGERGFQTDKDRDYSAFANDKKFRYALMNQGFDVTTLSLEQPVPDNINILVIAESRENFSDVANTNLDRYIARGGNLILLGEPKRRDVMNPLFAKFGFEMVPGQLVNIDPNIAPDVVLSFPTVQADSIAYDFGLMFRRRMVLITPGVAGLRQIEDKGYKVTEIFRSHINSWNEVETTDFVDDAVNFNPEAGEEKRSFSTLVALSRKIGDKEQRIILSGDADCISNGGLLGQRKGISSSNFSLIMGGFFWLSDNEVPIDVRRPIPTDYKVTLNKGEGNLVKWGLVFVLPLLLVGGGIFTWLRRRGR